MCVSRLLKKPRGRDSGGRMWNYRRAEAKVPAEGQVFRELEKEEEGKEEESGSVCNLGHPL